MAVPSTNIVNVGRRRHQFGRAEVILAPSIGPRDRGEADQRIPSEETAGVHSALTDLICRTFRYRTPASHSRALQ